MNRYDRTKGGRYKMDQGEFLSEHTTLSKWWHAMGAPDPPEAMQVCYGGVFSGSFRNIYKSTDVDEVVAGMDRSAWKNVEVSLSRGNNIQDGHYAERSWAAMIHTPLPRYQLEALVERADGLVVSRTSFHGALVRRVHSAANNRTVDFHSLQVSGGHDHKVRIVRDRMLCGEGRIPPT